MARLLEMELGIHGVQSNKPYESDLLDFAINRTATKAGGDENGWNVRAASYGTNPVNQYTNRS